MQYLIYAFNILLLLFWIRLWSAPSKEFYFNPFLSGTIRLTDTVITFLRPVLYVPEHVAALLVVLFLTLFKTALFSRLGLPWLIQLGTYFQFVPEPTSRALGASVLFSVLHSVVFLARLWTVYLLVRLITPAARVTRATEAMAFFARPFSRLPLAAQPAVLVLLHAGLCLLIARTGKLTILSEPSAAASAAPSASFFLAGPLYFQLLKTGWLAAASLADGLMLLTRTLFVLILCSLGATLLQSRGAIIICNEGVDLLLGRFARRGMGGAGFDFTPLLFFFVVDLMYNSICRGMLELIQSPLFNG